jgi:uncharacterized protein (DUF2147 family)
MKRCVFWLIFLLLVIGGRAMAEEADAIVGEWYTEENKALVEIYKADGVYNGKIVWLKEPKKDDGSEKLDSNNPDESKRGNPIIGLNLVNGFVYQGKGKWAEGTIYDPDNGKTYSCKMQLQEENSLKVRGFIGVSLIGRTQVWTRKNS